MWIAVIILGYIALGKAVFALINGFQRRRIAGVIDLFSVAVGLFICNIAVMAPVAFLRIDTRYNVSTPAAFSVWFGLYLLWAWGYDRLANGKLAWQEAKRRKELSKQIKLHLALITGAVLFSIPFYWLITTSLKPDDRTRAFPPDLIPLEQSKVKVNGEDKPVYIIDRDGKDVKVIKLAELEGDSWDVRAPGKDTPTWTVPSATVKPDLHPVLKWKNYPDALKFLPPEYDRGLRPLWNTIYITLLTIIGTIISSSLVAFAFARLRWPGRDLLFMLLLATMMIPGAVTMLPVFLIFRSFGWIDTPKPLWVPALFGSGFNIFLLRQFFMTIPNELEEAARIDGCSYFTIYWKIMLPLIKPALAALTIFAFMGSWNNFMGPLIYINSPEKVTLAYALQLFQGAKGGEPAMMTAAATLVMLPVLVVFFFTQRYMVQGVTLTGLKG